MSPLGHGGTILGTAVLLADAPFGQVFTRMGGEGSGTVLWDWLRLFLSSLFRNSSSRVSLPTSRSSFSILSLRAASSIGSLSNLPRLYYFFQW